MSRPTARAWEMLKRIGRYLKGKPRLIWKYDWQGETEVFDITSDANCCRMQAREKVDERRNYHVGHPSY